MEDNKELTEFVDQQRWLLNNGLVPDSVKNQLFFYGSIVHPKVQAVEVQIVPESKRVDYVIYVNKPMIKAISLYKELSTATSLFGMWRFKRLLKKEGVLDFHTMLNNFVTDFCGPKWVATVTVSDFDAYIDNIGEESGTGGQDQQPDKLPHE